MITKNMVDAIQILKGECHRCGQTDTVKVGQSVRADNLLKAIDNFAKDRKLHERGCRRAMVDKELGKLMLSLDIVRR